MTMNVAARAVADEEENHDTKPPQVNAELEMKLRRYELKHVDLELKLSASEEKVSEAALVLEEAERKREICIENSAISGGGSERVGTR